MTDSTSKPANKPTAKATSATGTTTGSSGSGSTTPKRRQSTLASLGIQTSSTAASATATSSSSSSSTASIKKASSASTSISSASTKNIKTSSPSVSKTRMSATTSARPSSTATMAATTIKRRGTTSAAAAAAAAAAATTRPSSIKTDNTSSSPTLTRSPTALRTMTMSSGRRSNVPSSTAATTAMSRRSSVLSNNSSSSSGTLNTTNKKRASMQSIDFMSEIQALKDQLIEKDEEIKRLKDQEENLKKEYEVKILSLKTPSEEDKEKPSISAEKIDQETDPKSIEEKARALYEERLKQEQERAQAMYAEQMEQIQEKHAKTLQLELDELRGTLTTAHEQQMNDLKAENAVKKKVLEEIYDSKLAAQEEQLNNLLSSHEAMNKDHTATIDQLKEQLEALEASNTISQQRKIQQQLDHMTAAYETLKRQNQADLEAIDRRYRDEMRALQDGNDDSAEVWLQKTKSVQQELDRLHDRLLQEKLKHEQEIMELKQAHEEEITNLVQSNQQKDLQLDEQAMHIQTLDQRIDALQTSLEAATTRLETTAKLSPTSSSITTTSNINHQECFHRIDSKQKELEALEKRLKDMKATHEAQIAKIQQDTATTVQEQKRTIVSLEQKLQQTASTPPHSPTRPPSGVLGNSSNTTGTQQQPQSFSTSAATIENDEETQKKLIKIAEMHRQEIQALHAQYQAVVDTKNQELQEFSYRLKAMSASRFKDLENVKARTDQIINKLESDIEGYERKFKDYQKHLCKSEEKTAHWQLLATNNEALIQDLKRECTSLTDERDQLSRLLSELQMEMHHRR